MTLKIWVQSPLFADYADTDKKRFYKNKKISHKALESLAASIHEADKRITMSHMDTLWMLMDQFNGVSGKPQPCNSDIYQVIEGKVLDVKTLRGNHGIEITVDSNSPVKTIIFNSFCSFNRGDSILASILKTYYNEDKSQKQVNHYYRRALNSMESAETIKIVKKGIVVATYQNL